MVTNFRVAGLTERQISWVEGNAEELPFEPNSMDSYTIGIAYFCRMLLLLIDVFSRFNLPSKAGQAGRVIARITFHDPLGQFYDLNCGFDAALNLLSAICFLLSYSRPDTSTLRDENMMRGKRSLLILHTHRSMRSSLKSVSLNLRFQDAICRHMMWFDYWACLCHLGAYAWIRGCPEDKWSKATRDQLPAALMINTIFSIAKWWSRVQQRHRQQPGLTVGFIKMSYMAGMCALNSTFAELRTASTSFILLLGMFRCCSGISFVRVLWGCGGIKFSDMLLYFGCHVFVWRNNMLIIKMLVWFGACCMQHLGCGIALILTECWKTHIGKASCHFCFGWKVYTRYLATPLCV